MTKEFTPDPALKPTPEFKSDSYIPLKQEVYVKKETGLDVMAGDGGYQEEKYLGNYLRFKMKRDGKRFWAGDNISEYVKQIIIFIGKFTTNYFEIRMCKIGK